MDIKLSLESNRSRENILRIARYISNNPDKIKELMELVLSKDDKISFRASWAMIHLSERKMAIIEPYFELLIKNLKEAHITDSVKRNTIRILQFADIPEKLQGYVADICFQLLSLPSEPIAVRAFSMRVLSNLSKQHPDLEHELKIVIEDLLPHASPGLKRRGEVILRELSK